MSFGEGVDRLLALISARSSGQAGDDDVERAVSALLADTGVAPAQARAPAARRTARSASAPVLDRTNYDDDDDREDSSNADGEPSKSAKQPRAPRTPSTARRLRCAAAAAASEERAAALKERAASLRKGDVVVPPPGEDDDGAAKGTPKLQKKRGRPRRKDAAALDEEHWEKFESTPLGRQGAKMMVTFGDGRRPDPGAVEAALLGTRRCLQCAIRDARSRRRRDRESYKLAREDAIAYRGLNITERRAGLLQPGTATVVDDPKLYFKAMAGYDTLGMDLPAGFDVAQLEALFPEEMQAYHRWKKMQSAYAKKSGEDEEDAMMDDEEKPSASDGKDDDQDEDVVTLKKAGSGEKNDDWVGGHLNDRLEQFDLRTKQMKEQWYLTFAEVRQGSFLGRGFRGNSSWNKARRKAGGKSFGRIGTWEDLAAGSVRFLHWVGFDPRSALPPPDEDSAQALAFLGYDFLGKIVERAILLRRLAEREERRAAAAAPKKRKSKRGRKHQAAASKDEESDDDDDTILELRPGEQLGSMDINEALRDSTIVAEPLYRTASETGPRSKPQLYFGPGFEDRIEVELEEIVLGKNKVEELSDGEKQIRCDEEELFSSLEGTPSKLEGVFEVLEQETSEEKHMAAEKSVDQSERRGGGLQPTIEVQESATEKCGNPNRPSTVEDQNSSTVKPRKKAKRR